MWALATAWCISAYSHRSINEAGSLAGRRGAAGKWVGGIYIELEGLGRKIEWCRDGGIVVCFYPSLVRWGKEATRETIRQLPEGLVAEGLGLIWEVGGIYEVWEGECMGWQGRRKESGEILTGKAA